MKKMLNIIFVLLFVLSSINAQTAQQLNPEFAKAKKFDTGKMWTFLDPPVDYLKEEYGFTATKEWLEHVRLAALRIPGCSASFISPNGLVMTNHHCTSRTKRAIQKEGENLENLGFYAETLADERKIPNYYVERLELMVDVSDEVTKAFELGKSQEEKVKNREAKIDELVKKYDKETGLKCQISSFYNGGKYAIYGYKRYTDVRMVFIPEPWIGEYGGDPDNFTYPRYDLDMTLLRVYDDNGQPLQTPHHYKWSPNGAQLNEPIFTVGNPGTTRRLKTVAQLEYYRDFQYKNTTFILNTYFDKLGTLQAKYPAKFADYERIKRSVGNSQKSQNGTYLGLLNPNLIARKLDFENKLKAQVNANPELKKKYGNVWDEISKTRTEMRKIGGRINAFTLRQALPMWYDLASKLVNYAKEMKKPEAERNTMFKEARLAETLKRMYPENVDIPLEELKLSIFLEAVEMNLGSKDPLVKLLTNGLKGQDAINYAKSKSLITSKEKFDEFIKMNPDEILKINDVFVKYAVNATDEGKKLLDKAEEINKKESVQENLLGQAMFAIYGTSIPPDANFTLRLSDGVLKKYEYNGTIAPVFTTFFGLYDRYYSHQKEYPWDLPEIWKGKDKEIDLSTGFNFVSTNDIVGGNSGSAIINGKAEVVGLAFDGNIESLNGNFIYMPETNRCVAVASQGMMLALEQVYKAKRLVEELKSGTLVK